MPQPPSTVDVVVIGAGQAGLSAAYHLHRRGFRDPATDEAARPGARTALVFDREDGPGGAWRHRWDSLRMATVNRIFDLPGMPVPPVDPAERSSVAVPAYFAAYEAQLGLPIHRPVVVDSVRRADTSDVAEPHRLVVASDAGEVRARYVVNATGTWRQPYWPFYPGRELFAGRQLHVHDYVSAEEFRGKRVVIVGAGVSAMQLLAEISRITETFWVARREPVWRTDRSTNRFVEGLAKVDERSRMGLPPTSIVDVTGSFRSEYVEDADARGVLVRHPMFTRVDRDGVWLPDGTFEGADVILWATGFRPDLRHLAPLALRTPYGGLRVDQHRSMDEPALFLVGYGSTQSTVGANRAGRAVVATIVRELDGREARSASAGDAEPVRGEGAAGGSAPAPR